jgi:hypothetical protein
MQVGEHLEPRTVVLWMYFAMAGPAECLKIPNGSLGSYSPISHVMSDLWLAAASLAGWTKLKLVILHHVPMACCVECPPAETVQEIVVGSLPVALSVRRRLGCSVVVCHVSAGQRISSGLTNWSIGIPRPHLKRCSSCVCRKLIPAGRLRLREDIERGGPSPPPPRRHAASSNRRVGLPVRLSEGGRHGPLPHTIARCD